MPQLGATGVSAGNVRKKCGVSVIYDPVEALYVKTGVGCASGIINGILGDSGECCCDKGGICA